MQAHAPSDIFIIDVSNHQNAKGAIDWVKVKASGVKGVYVKASEGKSKPEWDFYKDPYFVENVKGAQAVGLPVGAYHFAQPGVTDVASELAVFLEQLKLVNLDLLHVLDLEVSKLGASDLVAWTRDFLTGLESATGVKPMVYSAKWFTDSYEGLQNAFAGYKLWTAWYPSAILNPTDTSQITSSMLPPDFAGWTSWTMWQFASDGRIDGLIGDIDVNVVVSLDAIRIPKAQPTPAPSEDACELRLIEGGFAGAGFYAKTSHGYYFLQAEAGYAGANEAMELHLIHGGFAGDGFYAKGSKGYYFLKAEPAASSEVCTLKYVANGFAGTGFYAHSSKGDYFMWSA